MYCLYPISRVFSFTRNPLLHSSHYASSVSFVKIRNGGNLVQHSFCCFTTHVYKRPQIIPYGDSSFETIRNDHQMFIDNTRYIRLLEDVGKQLFFVRPPRFGKSLLVSMLASYYDVGKKESFKSLFGDLEIGKNPTSESNSYFVLPLDFSIEVDTGIPQIRQNLHDNINSSLQNFSDRYNLSFQTSKKNAFYSYAGAVNAVQKQKGKLMVLVDEYDRFANKLMFESPDKYNKIVAGKSGDPASSPVRSFFETLKTTQAANIPFRSFITGISPVALADASGYNVAEDISLNRFFSDMVGFSEEQLNHTLGEIGCQGEEKEEVLKVMERYFDGYRFVGSTKPLYNPTLCWFFLKKYVSDEQYRDMIHSGNFVTSAVTDKNTKISENIFGILARSPFSQRIITSLSNPKQHVIAKNIVNSFKLREIMEPTDDSMERVLSFMFYQGIVTISESTSTKLEGEREMKVPNEVAKIQFLNEFRKIIKVRDEDMANLLHRITEENLKQFLWGIIKQLETIPDNSFSEGALQGAIESALKAINTKNQFGEIRFERAYDDGKKIADLVIELEKDTILIELKRVRPNAVPYSGGKFDEQQLSETINWHPDAYSSVFEFLGKLSESDLLALPIAKSRQQYYKYSSTVQNVLDRALVQAKDYGSREQKLNPTKTTHVFVVLQVGKPLIVRKVS